MATRTRRKNRRTNRMLKVLVVLLALILAAAVGLLFLLGQQETPPEPTPGPTTAPTSKPTEPPTEPPTDAPTQAPTQEPTEPPYTGWQEIDGNTYYLVEDVPCTGIVTIEDATYCFGSDGALIRENWLDSGDKRYYADENGQITVGWLKLNNNRYYFLEDGTMARGKVEIQKETWFFASDGSQLYLVNPWNYVPDGYKVTIKDIPSKYATSKQISADIYDDLMQMIKDCEADMAEIYGENVHVPFIRSAWRSMADQRYLFENKVNKVKAKHPEYTQAQAEQEAAKAVAIPGTSEHQLGLAVDIVDSQMRDLNESQEKTPVQKWLMEHCWEYGFILRFPNGTTDITGIIYEPWHYRYVGRELAEEIHHLGITLEEYIENLTTD